MISIIWGAAESRLHEPGTGVCGAQKGPANFLEPRFGPGSTCARPCWHQHNAALLV